MKGKIIAAGFLAALAVTQNAEAKSLEDLLKEKGVITEADYKEVTKNRPIDYKLGRGFTLTSEDGKFQLSVGGRLMARYSYTDKEYNLNSGKVDPDVSQFAVQKANLWFRGYAYSKDLAYHVELDLASAGNSKMLEQAYMKYRVFDELQVLGGQTKVPFSRQYLVSTGSLEFVDRSPATKAFAPTYDTGAYLSGKLFNGILNYDVAVVGGAGQTTFRSTNDNALAARIVTNPLGDFAYSEGDPDTTGKPLFTLGADIYYNTLARSGTGFETNNDGYAQSSGWLGKNAANFNALEKVRITMLSADAAFKWMGAFLQGEYYWGQGDGTWTDKTVFAQGGYGQLGYCILPGRLETAVRFSTWDPNRSVGNDLQSEIIGAVSYYFRKHNLKLQADIGNIHTQGSYTNPVTKLKEASDDMQYRFNATVVF